jgi:hypothetical protein
MLEWVVRAAAVTVLILLVVLGTGIWIGASEAARHAVPGITPAEEEFALEEAQTGIWDNPFERLLYFSMAVTQATRVGDASCTTYEVTAYTFFGRAASTMETDCSGGSRRTS